MSITAKTKLTENQTNKVLNINSGMSLLHTLALVQTGILFNKEILEGYKTNKHSTKERNNTLKALVSLLAKEKVLIKAIKAEQKKEVKPSKEFIKEYNNKY
jgi:hypothetical protein